MRETLDEVGHNGWIVLEAAAPNALMVDYSHDARILREVFPAKA